MKIAFGIPLNHIDENNRLEFNAQIVSGNLRKCYLISIMGSFFILPLLYLDWLRLQNGDLRDFGMFCVFLCHCVFCLFLPISLYIFYNRNSIFQENQLKKKQIIVLITLIFSLSLLPMAMAAVPSGGSILVYGIFIMLINFVLSIEHRWRLFINLACMSLMIAVIFVFKSDDLIYCTVRTLECIGTTMPAFAFATYHYNTKVKEFTNIKLLNIERERSDALLYNILPIKTANELKANGKSTPHFYEAATVLFTDFKDFSKQSADLDPNVLIDILNDYFKAFDTICKCHQLEKIKTIGDAYMAVSGLPNEDKNHAINACRAALEMQQFVSEYNDKALKDNKLCFEMRVGLHSGALIAGVVGNEKFSFDIWGNTVNTAARMESNGQVGKVNISVATYQLVKHVFECEAREKKHIKNLGEVEMYFVK